MHHYSSFPLRNAPNIKTNREPHHSGETLASSTSCPQPLRSGFSCLETLNYNSYFQEDAQITLLCHFDSTDGFHELPST